MERKLPLRLILNIPVLTSEYTQIHIQYKQSTLLCF